MKRGDLLRHLRVHGCVTEPVKIQQMSALHGLNHLGDPRTPELVARMARTFADEEVRNYGAAAARFELP